MTRGDLDHALALYQESLNILEQLGDKKGKIVLLGQLGAIHFERRNWEQAEELLQMALALAQEIGAPPAFEVVKLGQIAQARGNNETALELYRNGLSIFEKMDVPEANQVRKMISDLEKDVLSKNPELVQLISDADLSVKKNDLERAITLYEQAIAIFDTLGNIQGKGSLLYKIAEIYILHGELDNAKTFVQNAKEIYKELEDRREFAACLMLLGDIENSNGNLDRARWYYKDALDQKAALNPGNSASLLEKLGILELNMSFFGDAIEHLSEARDILISLKHEKATNVEQILAKVEKLASSHVKNEDRAYNILKESQK
jgi:tetratricopeptide (TPR) repeat protein